MSRAAAALEWRDTRTAVRRHARGASLAISAPTDRLFLATEVNEWALCVALAAPQGAARRELQEALGAAWLESVADLDDPAASWPPVLEEPAALARFQALADLEAVPGLRELLDAAATRQLPQLLDETELTLGSGAGSRSFALAELPAVPDVPWQDLHGIPTALVTGSNGKTTTVRLLAACARARGWRTGYSCTDGVFSEAAERVAGDYSGPAGARLVLRDPSIEAAVLETARGGILRRGLGVAEATVAVVTNVSADHFGEYGIDDLPGLADVKLSVAAVLGPHGLLVLNADDALLVDKSQGLRGRFGHCPPLGWFARHAEHALLRTHRARGGACCGERAGHLWLSRDGAEHDLGAIAAMPLSIGGLAVYNLGNLAAAALAAHGLGIDPEIIASVFADFGRRPDDNSGRMMNFELGGARVLVDYAHNPDGLRGLLTVAAQLRAANGRLGLLLGHAGNRQNADIEALARVAAEFRPDLVVIKENETQLRGRAPGEIPRLLRAELLRQNIAESALPICDTEFAAVQRALDWARPGDILILPVHSAAARARVIALLDRPPPQ